MYIAVSAENVLGICERLRQTDIGGGSMVSSAAERGGYELDEARRGEDACMHHCSVLGLENKCNLSEEFVKWKRK